jgi:hypothetical protein
MWNSGEFYHGWTIGGQWYVIHGGFQDWAYNWRHELHVTLEVGTTKWPAWTQMETYWNNNRDSMLWFMNRTLTTGVQGTVTDVNTGAPLDATVSVTQIGLPIIADTQLGDYHRLLNAGTYTLTFTLSGYPTVTVPNVVVVSGAMTTLDVQMGTPSSSVDPIASLGSSFLRRPMPNPMTSGADQVRLGYSLGRTERCRGAIFDAQGREVRVLVSAEVGAGDHELAWDGRDSFGRSVPAGAYWVRLSAGGHEAAQKIAVAR